MGGTLPSPWERGVTNTNDPTDQELVERIHDGDVSAFRVLFGRYEASALGRIRQRLPVALRRKVDPDDILQDAYLVAAQRFPEFRGRHEGSFGKWLAQIVEFKVRESARHYLDASKRDAHREITRGARPDTHHFRGKQPTPSQMAIGAELAERAREALTRLREDDRRVLDLVQAQGLDLHEAATHLGRSYEATKKLYGRELTRLKSLLEADDA
jgi:RNA polymerase sigma-70 factor (ECF subfamily)